MPLIIIVVRRINQEEFALCSIILNFQIWASKLQIASVTFLTVLQIVILTFVLRKTSLYRNFPQATQPPISITFTIFHWFDSRTRYGAVAVCILKIRFPQIFFNPPKTIFDYCLINSLLCWRMEIVSSKSSMKH